jgi:hypothetical protein
MPVPDDIRKCVAFIGFQVADGTFRLAGSAWLVGDEVPTSGVCWSYLVTAAHVVRSVRDLGCDKIYIRFNLTTGTTGWLASALAEWYFHPTDAAVDVAVLRVGLPDTADHLLYPLASFATEESIARDGISVGDEVFLAGLFANHFGQQRNIPIVRVGNIAAMPEEHVITRMGPIEAFLVECRSIGGLSGSPVFAHLGLVRYVDGKVQFAQRGPVFRLIGLMHGHWDVKEIGSDAAKRDADVASIAKSVNMGIAIVVPAWKIYEVIKQTSILEAQTRALAAIAPC